MSQNRPIIPVGVGLKKPSILRGWFGGVLENLLLKPTDKEGDIEDYLSPWRNLPYDIASNLTFVTNLPGGRAGGDQVTVKADSLNPVYAEIFGILSQPRRRSKDPKLRSLRLCKKQFTVKILRNGEKKKRHSIKPWSNRSNDRRSFCEQTL
jgi:hypothetical protein